MVIISIHKFISTGSGCLLLKLILCVELLTIVLLNTLADIKLPFSYFGYMKTIYNIMYQCRNPDLEASPEVS